MGIKEKIKEILSTKKNVTVDDLKIFLRISKYEKKEFKHILRQMREEGTLDINERGFLTLGERKPLYGVFSETKYNYGFVNTEDGVEYFIPGKDKNGALEGDVVLIEKLDKGPGRTVARVLKVTDRKERYVVCDIKNKNRKMIVTPMGDFDSFIHLQTPPKGRKYKDGKYKVRLLDYDKRKKKYMGEVVEFIGTDDDKYLDLKTLVSEYDLPIDFPEDVIENANFVSREKILPSERVDYRDIFTVTIDGEDAKDFDDAISVEKTGENSYFLYVHIADVSHYVKDGAPLDVEAKKRDFSIYLPGLTIPMLPHVLSNGVCSLNPNEDRYTMSVKMEIRNGGEPKMVSIDKAIINSDYRLTYDGVSELFETGDNADYNDELKEFLMTAREVYNILKSQSEARGTISFMSSEAKFIMDDMNRIVDILPRPQREAEELIEEMMIATNRVVSKKYREMELPFIYRIHEEPTDEKLEGMRTLLRPFGVKVPEKVSAKDIQKLLEDLSEHESFERINDIVLRSMMKANYSDENIGHFALALADYSHFTSPIRRYPDLFIHRIISQKMSNRLTERNIKYFGNKAKEVAEEASNREKQIVDLEREADSLKKCEYMKNRVYEIYDGKVSGITEFGMFVKLPNTVEGLICNEEFMDNYLFDEKEMTAITTHNNKKYEIGTPVRVKVVNVNMMRREIDFMLLEDEDGR